MVQSSFKEDILRPGIKEGVLTFWKRHDAREPKLVTNDHDRLFITECVILALAAMSSVLDKT